MEEKKVIANIIKIRQKQRFTKRALAEALFMSEANYGKIESGKVGLSFRQLSNIANILGYSVIDIITYPDKYVPEASPNAEPVEAILQIKLQKDKKDQVLRLVFGNNNLEILNK